jgi:hypothetical protein
MKSLIVLCVWSAPHNVRDAEDKPTVIGTWQDPKFRFFLGDGYSSVGLLHPIRGGSPLESAWCSQSHK